MLISLLELYLKGYTKIFFVIFIKCCIQILLLKLVTKQRLSNITTGTSIAIALAYIVFLISGILEFVFQKILFINSNIINLILVCCIEILISTFILKLKRLKNGLTFLHKNDGYIDIIPTSIIIFLFLIYAIIWSGTLETIKNLFYYLIILGICLIFTVQKILIMHYKQKLIDDTINDYKKELEKKDEEIKRLTEESFKVSKINHEFYNRQKSLELMVKNAVQNMNMEASEEIDILSKIEEITSEHTRKMNSIKLLPELERTEIEEVDDMFNYMQSECANSGIQFKLKINGNIHPLINNIIEKNRLVTLIGDHIRDAIIAVNFAETSNKEIFVILGIKDNYYELCIYDTGIEFEIDTLIKLGTEPITTHKDTGGSGIGFVTTFETLKACKASLVIEEKQTIKDSGYTKVVKFVFDNKSEYRINSYRANEIKKQNYNDRIVIKSI